MKKLLWIGPGVLALVIALVLLVPPFVDLGKYKARYLPAVEKALNRKVDVKVVRLRVLPSPAIRVSNLNVADNPSFSRGTFFSAEAARLQLKLWPLLTGRLVVDEFVLEKPWVSLIKRPDGTFNFSDLAGREGTKDGKPPARAGRESPAETAGLAGIIPSRVSVENGMATLQTPGDRPLVIRNIELSIKEFSVSRPFPYRVALRPQGSKPVVLEGSMSYEEPRAALRLKDNRLKAKDIEFSVNGDVSRLTSTPEIDLTVANPDFETGPIFKLLAERGLLPKGWDISGPAGLTIALRGPSNHMISSVDARLAKIRLSDARTFRGILSGAFRLSLPTGGDAPLTRSVQGAGKLVARDGALTNTDLLSAIRLLTGLIGMPQGQDSGVTTFETLETDFTVGNGLVEIQRLFLSSPLLQASGQGRITLASLALNFSIEAALSPETSAKAGRGEAATFFKDAQGRIVVPLKVTGPPNKPSVDLDKEKLIQKGTGRLLEKARKELERFFRPR